MGPSRMETYKHVPASWNGIINGLACGCAPLYITTNVGIRLRLRQSKMTHPPITDFLAETTDFINSLSKLSRMLREGFSVGDDEDPIIRAQRELEEKGITREQRKVYKQGISEAIYKTINPWGYPPRDPIELLKILGPKIAKNIGKGEKPEGVFRPEDPEKFKHEDETIPTSFYAFKEDAWRLYLGLPQKFSAIAVSEYKPTKVKEGDQPYYFKHKKLSRQVDREIVDRVISVLEEKKKEGSGSRYLDEGYGLGNFNWSKGEDDKGHYIAYYDKWDFDIPFETLVGKPLEFYDRIYYDPKTYEPIREPKNGTRRPERPSGSQ